MNTHNTNVQFDNTNLHQMKTAVIYSSKYGSTERVARLIVDNLINDVTLLNTNSEVENLQKYDKVIIGFPVYASTTTRDMRSFLKKNWEKIKYKINGIFILCWDEKRLNDFIANVFPEKPGEQVIIESMGGEINPDKLLEVEKSIIFDLIGITKKESTISEEKIRNFALKVEKFNK